MKRTEKQQKCRLTNAKKHGIITLFPERYALTGGQQNSSYRSGGKDTLRA